MKIGDLSNATETPVETIRYCEREGLLPPAARTAGNYRVYGDENVRRLALIRRCRSLDMTIEEIRTLLRFRDAPTESCAEVNGLLDAHIRHVAERIHDLRALEKDLRALREKCAQASDAARCGILVTLAQERDARGKTSRKERGHVGAMHDRR
jgi:Cd(II)/Pb(II)-responsive transcriptional regulator